MAVKKATGKKAGAAAAEAEEPVINDDPNVPQPRLRALTIKNFRCIGPEPIRVELDDIVVLVGRNNVREEYHLARLRSSDVRRF